MKSKRKACTEARIKRRTIRWIAVVGRETREPGAIERWRICGTRTYFMAVTTRDVYEELDETEDL